MNSIELPHPVHLTPAQRAAEITQILARSIRRQQAELSGDKDRFGLGFLPDQRGNATPQSPESKP